MKVGIVSHYYDKIGVAIVDLSAEVHVGDHIKFVGSSEFSQNIDSLQMDHEQVQSADKGDTVGLKVIQAVSVGDEVIKTT